MTQVIIEDIDPIVVEKLKHQAVLRGRSHQAELKYILEASVSSPYQPTANIALIPLEDLQQAGQTALNESIYHSREKIIDPVQEVKKEIAGERVLPIPCKIY
jgi:plasmid stability protein